MCELAGTFLQSPRCARVIPLHHKSKWHEIFFASKFSVQKPFWTEKPKPFGPNVILAYGCSLAIGKWVQQQQTARYRGRPPQPIIHKTKKRAESFIHLKKTFWFQKSFSPHLPAAAHRHGALVQRPHGGGAGPGLLEGREVVGAGQQRRSAPHGGHVEPRWGGVRRGQGWGQGSTTPTPGVGGNPALDGEKKMAGFH